MARLVRAVGIGAILSLLGLSGCADPPWTMAQSPGAIHLRWYPDLTSPAEADQVAELHCAHVGRRAVLASNRRDGSAETATWLCE